MTRARSFRRAFGLGTLTLTLTLTLALALLLSCVRTEGSPIIALSEEDEARDGGPDTPPDDAEPIDEAGSQPTLPLDPCALDGSAFFSSFDAPLEGEWTGAIVEGSGFMRVTDASAASPPTSGAFGVGPDGGTSLVFQRVACISGTNQTKLPLRIDLRASVGAECGAAFAAGATRLLTLRFERLANQTIYELALFQDGTSTTLREIADRDASTIVTHPAGASLAARDASAGAFQTVRLDLELERSGGTFILTIDDDTISGTLALTQTRGSPIVQVGVDGVTAHDASAPCEIRYDDVRVTRRN